MRETFTIQPPAWPAEDEAGDAPERPHGALVPLRFSVVNGAGTVLQVLVAVPRNASPAATERLGYDAVHRALAEAAIDTRAYKLDEAERLMLRSGLPPSAK